MQPKTQQNRVNKDHSGIGKRGPARPVMRKTTEEFTMASYNKVILIGNLTRDPEMKYLPSGSAVTNFGIAMNERYTDKQTGEQRENPCFVDVEAWGRQAEVVNEYFSKGRPILIEGALKFDSWEAEDGTKRSRLKVRLIRFEFIGGRQDGEEVGDSYAEARPAAAAAAAAAATPQPSNVSEPVEAAEASATDDDIPF